MALPVPVKTGYAFQGWYDNKECIGEAITSVSSAKTLYAKWIVDQSQIDPNDVLSCISDVATSNTVDNLITKIDDVTYEWSSSNPNLYVIENGKGTVSKVYQTHKTQEVTITATGKNPDGTTFTKSKKITVNPVLYDELPNTPVATYFSTSAMYAYKQYNERYKANKTIFSENTKKILNIIYYSFAVIDSISSPETAVAEKWFSAEIVAPAASILPFTPSSNFTVVTFLSAAPVTVALSESRTAPSSIVRVPVFASPPSKTTPSSSILAEPETLTFDTDSIVASPS